ncbi:hypothetical protein G6F56_007519 [Rhizopus delemar]|nr:hypothetical protein G6F56_007519 [Rhizopus delemar]
MLNNSNNEASPFWLSILATPTQRRGIAILDPSTQHAALQLRWLQPLLLPSTEETIHDTFVTKHLRHCLRHFASTSSHLLPLLLPVHRSITIKSFGCFENLSSTIDKIDYDINYDAFNSFLFNELSLAAICPDLVASHLGFQKNYWFGLLVKHAYMIDSSCRKFRRRPLLASDPHRNHINKYFDILTFCQAQEIPSFLRFKCTHGEVHNNSSAWIIPSISPSSFGSILDSSLPDGTPLISLTTKWFVPLCFLIYPLYLISIHAPTIKLGVAFGVHPFLIKPTSYYGAYTTTSFLAKSSYIEAVSTVI